MRPLSSGGFWNAAKDCESYPSSFAPSVPTRGAPNRSTAPRGLSAALIDHLVGTDEEGRRDRHSERSCGSHVDDELELRRLLDRQVSGLLAAQDAIRVDREAHVGGALVGAVARQPARVAVFAPAEH